MSRSLARSVLTLGVVALTSAVTPDASAQQTAPETGFRIYSSSFSSGYDTGISSEDGSVVADTVFEIVPGALVYGTASATSGFQFIYEPEFEIFRTATELNAVNHAAAAGYRLEANRSLTVDFGGTFLRTDDRSRQTNGLTLVPRGTFLEGRVHGNVQYRASDRTSLQFGVDTTYSETPTFLNTSNSGTVDNLTSSLRAGVARQVGRRHSLSLSYTHLRTNLLNPEDLPEAEGLGDRGSETASAGYAFSTATGLRLSASFGVIRSPETPTNDVYTYAWSGRIGKSWDAASFGFGYARSLAALLRLEGASPADQIRDPLLSTSVSETIDLGFSGRFAGRVAVDQRAQWSRSEFATSDDLLETASAGITVAVRTGGRLAPFGSASYWRQAATAMLPEFSRTRISAGVRVYLGSSLSNARFANAEPARSLLPIGRIQ